MEAVNPEFARLFLLSRAVEKFIKEEIIQKECQSALAIVEDYAYGDSTISIEEFRKMDKMSLEVAEAYGVILSILASYSVPTIKVTPSQMKYFVTGDGHCQKTDIIKKMYKIYDVVMNDDHQYDALALAHIGRYFVLFCQNQNIIPEGTYEYNVIVRLAYDQKYTMVSKELGLNL
jgi:Holliday junction resolvasome RuvABC endonuclease subunit